MADASESELSADENPDDLGQFDLIEPNENDRRYVEDALRNFHDLFGESDDEEDNFEGFEVADAYVAPDFTGWGKTNNQRNIVQFTERVGPTRVIDASSEAVDFFQIFYSDELFSEIVRFTNLNAERKRAADPNQKGPWSEVSLEEIKAYYGMLIMMDIVKMERDELYWSTSGLLETKIGEIMSRDRFVQIKRYLHFSDDTEPQDKLHKIRFMLDHLRNAFKAEYSPHKQITVDEAMVPFKGRLGLKQYMKDKPVKWGIKLWVAADAVSAYCYNFEVYVGKENNVNGHLGLSSRVVVNLTRDVHNKGHVIFTDNFYTSPTLADYLFQQGTYLCGTVRPNRKGFPKDLVMTKPQQRRQPRGFSDWRMCGPILATSWKDNRVVYYLSTYHDPEENMVARRKLKDGTDLELPSTPTVMGYAKYMNGVDRLDQNCRVDKSKKSMRWYRKIEIKLREMALYNAYVIEGSVIDHRGDNKRKRDLLSFRKAVAYSLIGNFCSKKAFKRRRSDANDDIRLDHDDKHWPCAAGGASGCDRLCVVCLKKHNLYKSSHPGVSVKDDPFKRTKTSMACEKCDVALCCNAKSSCFKDWHTKVYYWQ